MKVQPPTADLNEISKALNILFNPSDIVELRIIHNGRKRTDAGYFDYSHRDELAKVAAANNRYGNVYITMNPLDPQLLSRYHNRLQEYAPDTASDANAISRRWILIDCDPKRPKGTSSTEVQLQSAYGLAEEIRKHLLGRGFPEPVVAMSGNGYHLLYKVDMPNTDEVRDSIRDFLVWLNDILGNEIVTIDTAVYNAGRITKLYGTVARKGDNTALAPHRVSRILTVPDTVEVVDIETITRTILPLDPLPRKKQDTYTTSTPFDLDGFLDRQGIPFVHDRHSGRDRYKLEYCPFNPEHGKGEAAIFREPDGTLGFKCQHDSCSGKHWRDVRELIDGPRKNYISTPFTEAPGAVVCDAPDLLTDQRIKHYFADRYKHLARYVPGISWHVWNGCRWCTDIPGGLHPLIDQMQRQLWAETTNIKNEEERVKRRKALLGLEMHGRQLSLIQACQTVPALITGADCLDRDKTLLNCQNGTLDLRTSNIRPHEPADLITRIVNIKYDPTAECPTFIKFITWAMCGNDELVSYLQRFIGYCLTGMTSEQVLNFWYGTGGNGKTTLMNVVQWLLCDYATTADTGLIMQRSTGNDSNRLSMLAGLRGARVVTLTEVNDGEKLDEAAIKSFTGGDVISCRHLYERFFSYTPQAKLIGFGNYKPNVRGTDHGIWRRIHLVPFLAVIAEEDKDPSLPEKLRAELPGILAWAVRGCLEWQRIGLAPPDAIRNATQEYREAEDIFSNWLNECCTVSHGGTTVAGDLLDSYKKYSGWNSISQTKFGRMLSGHGFIKRKSNGKVFWDGLKLYISDSSDSYPPFSEKSHKKEVLKSFPKMPSTITTVTCTEIGETKVEDFDDLEGVTHAA